MKINGSFSVHSFNEHYLSILGHKGTECFLKTVPSATCVLSDRYIVYTKVPVFMKSTVAVGNSFQESHIIQSIFILVNIICWMFRFTQTLNGLFNFEDESLALLETY